VERALWTAELGEVVGPLENQEGWWIFRVADSRPAPVETDRESDGPRLEDYILEPLYMARARVVQDSLRDAAGVRYPVDGRQLLLRKYYWEPPPGMEDDPMAFLNDPRMKPSFTAEEETVVVVSFVDQPDWTASEFADRLEWYGGGMWPRGHSVEQLEESMDMVVRDHLLLKAGDDIGVTSEPEYKESIEDRYAQMRVNVLYNNVITASVEPTEEDIRAWFEENRERYKATPSYRLATFWSADPEAMRALAADWRDGASFSELREKYEARVDDLQFQGDSSWIHMGNDVALDDAVTPVADGSVGEPFLRNGTWFVFKVLDRRGERLTSYEEVKEIVDRDAVTMAKERALVSFLEEQREKYAVTVDREALEAMELPEPAAAQPAS
jgi:parvulin-like peptidyl-prolyl isomerase